MHKLIIPLLAALSLGTIAVAAESLPAADKDFLAGYEKIQSALAADDLAAAKKAATDLGESGAALAKSGSLKEARSSFEALSLRAEELATGQPGYYVAYCPMVKKSWVQTSTKISNPYMGKGMSTCGEIKSGPR